MAVRGGLITQQHDSELLKSELEAISQRYNTMW